MILDQRLRDDSYFITDLTLCQVRLSHNALYPWVILIPRGSDLSELTDLGTDQQNQLMAEINKVAKAMTKLFKPHKLNVASLGNVVPQLHIHIIARFQDDDAWPNPVWNGSTKEYDSQELQKRILSLEEALII
jgi:diadenosine tetraphosphate (Ap4A) HIT family hydrolase